MGHRPIHRDPEAGVTLVEILVVLSIIAITTGAAMLRLGFGRSEEDFTAAAEAMAMTVTAASDDALQTGLDRVLQLGPEGYRIVAADAVTAPSWHSIPDLTFRPAEGSAALRLSADAASTPFVLRFEGAKQSLFLRFDGLKARVEGAP